MRVEVVPSSVPVSGLQFLVTFLIDDVLAIDAGALGLMADLQRQQQVRHVFITHEHIDHIATLPIFLENVYDPGPECVELLAQQDVLDFLHLDIFNGRVWPDFFALSTAADPCLVSTPLAAGRPVARAGLTITPVQSAHGVETMGFIVDDGRCAVAFPSDTGPSDAPWARPGGDRHLAAVFLECSFPAALAGLAEQTGHLSTPTFAAEVAKVPAATRVIVVHRKPRYAAEIDAEIGALRLPNVELARPGEIYEF